MQQPQSMMGKVTFDHIKHQGSVHWKIPETENNEGHIRGRSFAMSKTQINTWNSTSQSHHI